ncbi:MAG: ribokinase [Eubacteriales bacterium]
MKRILIIGSMNMDFVFQVHHMPAVGETVLTGDLTFIPGGKGANQAYAAGKLGGNVAMLGAVGDDEHGRSLCDNLASVVDVSQIRRVQGVSTGVAFIGVNAEGNNSIIVVQGANRCVDQAYLEENHSLLEACDIVVMQLEIPLDSVMYAAKEAKRLGKTVILDPAPAVRLPEELYQNVDIVKPNEVELGELLGDPEAHRRLEESCKRLLDLGAKTSSSPWAGRLLPLQRRRQRFYADKTVKVVDTTAAGDSFTAAIALALAEDRSLEEAVEFATKVSNIVVTRKGAQTSIPSRDEVK